MNQSETHDIHPDDAEALDFLVESGFDSASIERMPERLRPRARRLLESLRRIDSYPASAPSDTLIDATLAIVAQEEHRRSQRFRLDGRSGRRWNLPNAVAVAAVFLVGIGVLYPVANEVRSTNSQAMCASGLRGLGGGFSAYAADHMGSMPQMASLAGPLLGGPGATKVDSGILANARHLEMLASGGYCDAGCTKCNGARALSYRVPMHARHTQLASLPRSPIAGDSNPVQPLIQRGGTLLSADMRSQNHGQRGQNLLYSDGSTAWTISPVIRAGSGGPEDNIWVIQGRRDGSSVDFSQPSGELWDIFLAN
ncbi:MAG: hypothetical protein EXS03_01795 [Phycisphaerales bacterium]|nr:hypothetical protein [Phycisphaerales bacterium]